MAQAMELPTHPDFARQVEQAETDAWLDLEPKTEDCRNLKLEPVHGAILVLDRAEVQPMSRVLGLGVNRPATPESVRAVLDTARSAGIDALSTNLSPIARPGTLTRILQREGFQPAERSVVVARNTAGMHEPDNYFRIRPACENDCDAMTDVMHSASQAPLDWCRLLCTQCTRDSWRLYLAWEDDTPCAVTGAHIQGDMAWLGPCWTKAEFRNRGTQAALIASAVRDLEAGGVQWVTASYPAAKSSKRGNFDRLGFSMVYLRTTFTWQDGSS